MRTTGKVKWFDPVAGDGCVVSEGGTQAALSRATLAAADMKTIAPGTSLIYEVKLADEGLTVTEIYEVGGKPAGKIKWFDAAKGFGFIVGGDVQGDVLMHRSVINATRTEDTTVDDEQGAKIRRLLPRRLARHRYEEEAPAGPWVDAQCRWFSRSKGFGFVFVDGDGEDVFVHMDTLRRCNIRGLRGGQRVKIRISRTRSGPMASEVAVVPKRDEPSQD